MQRRPASELRLPPHTCVVTGRGDLEVIDFNVSPACNEPPNIAVAVPVIEEAARDHLGMLTAKQAEELRAENKQLCEAVERHESATDSTDAQLEAALERVIDRRAVRVFYDEEAPTTSDEPTSQSTEEE